MLKTYKTVQGDMWDSIAYKCYGDENGINALLEANEIYTNLVVFPADIVLVVPEYKKSAVNTLPPWRR